MERHKISVPILSLIGENLSLGGKIGVHHTSLFNHVYVLSLKTSTFNIRHI
jgi:hypothetical protein